MPRSPIPSWFYVLVVVRQEDRFLVVQEARDEQQWYLPAGRVEPGESFIDAARRETLEESGVPVTLVGILTLEHTPRETSTRVRVIFLAHPTDDTPPKSIADSESIQARWVTIEELERLPLRDPRLPDLFHAVLHGMPASPLSLITLEGAFPARS